MFLFYMNIKDICNKSILIDFIIRIILSIITFYLLKQYYSENKYLYLIIPFLLIILDLTDNITQFIFSKLYNFSKDICTHTFLYQSLDKIVDLLSYICIWYLFDKTQSMFILIIVRLIGILFFHQYKKSFSLMIFPDLIKEFMVYKYFNNTNNNFIYIVILKIIFEIYYHSYKNLTSY